MKTTTRKARAHTKLVSLISEVDRALQELNVQSDCAFVPTPEVAIGVLQEAIGYLARRKKSGFEIFEDGDLMVIHRMKGQAPEAEPETADTVLADAPCAAVASSLLGATRQSQ